MSPNLSDSKPPLSPDVEVFLQILAGILRRLTRDHCDGEIDPGIQDLGRAGAATDVPILKPQPIQKGPSPVPSRSLAQSNYSASVLKCQRWSKVSKVSKASNAPDTTIWIGMSEALAILGISRNTLKGLIQAGKLPAYTIEGVVGYRFKRHEVEALIKPIIPKGTKIKKVDSASSQSARKKSKI
jgi:excisionase family DNA binding protein